MADEVRQLVGAAVTSVHRFGPNGVATFLAGAGWRSDIQPGGTWAPDPAGVISTLWKTGRSVRMEHGDPPEHMLDTVRAEGLTSSLAGPITVGGRLWGAIAVSARHGTLAPDTEQRLGDVSDLVASAIANATAAMSTHSSSPSRAR